jgi:hypothetical protein
MNSRIKRTNIELELILNELNAKRFDWLLFLRVLCALSLKPFRYKVLDINSF